MATGKPCHPIIDPDGDPDFWHRSTRTGGVLLRVVYEPSRSRFHFGMNAGTRCRRHQWISLGPARPKDYTGRVLRFLVVVAPGSLLPTIDNPALDRGELFGDLTLTSSSRHPPWGAAPTGNWWVMSGCENRPAEDETSFPAGFGLSDVRVTLIDEPDYGFDRLQYSGELDHLLRDDEAPFSEDADPEAVFSQEDMDLVLGLTEPNLSFELEEPGPAFELTEPRQVLENLAHELRALCDDACDWADRAEGLAERAEELACV